MLGIEVDTLKEQSVLLQVESPLKPQTPLLMVPQKSPICWDVSISTDREIGSHPQNPLNAQSFSDLKQPLPRPGALSPTRELGCLLLTVTTTP